MSTTMTEQQIKDQFLDVYNNRADDIFAYCYERIAHRDVAKYLTRNIFMKTWDLIGSAGASVVAIEKALFQIARDHISGFIQSKRHEVNYSENLWNLTLSQ
jgi:hypothetical protein